MLIFCCGLQQEKTRSSFATGFFCYDDQALQNIRPIIEKILSGVMLAYQSLKLVMIVQVYSQ